jgi:hypothetical protein
VEFEFDEEGVAAPRRAPAGRVPAAGPPRHPRPDARTSAASARGRSRSRRAGRGGSGAGSAARPQRRICGPLAYA